MILQSSGNVWAPLIATGLAAVLFQPLRERLQGVVNRMMYGDRDDPSAVLRRLGGHLEESGSPETQIEAMVETVAQALKLPYVAIALGASGELLASYGLPAQDILPFPIRHQGETIGQLKVAPRDPRESLTAQDYDLLATIARQAGPVLHSAQLTGDLLQARERLVSSREEERRRIRRDLHDGLGPELAALTLKLDAARNLLNTDLEATDDLLVDLKAQTQDALAEIRRLVYDLRPPALDELGLLTALREKVGNLPGGAMRIQVEGPEQMPPLPAAVEVAAYRLALEAIGNAIRHSRGDRCLVRIVSDDGLLLRITDNGIGLPKDATPGMGMTSMGERVAELGGTLDVQEAPEGGMQIQAWLPLRGAEN